MKLIELKSTVSQRVLLESLDSTNRNSYYLWENVGQRISEAQLSTAQINALFGAVEQNATDSGSNRTIVGKGKDAYDAVSAAYSDLKNKIYNSGPMENFAAQYDKAADALKDKAGGDQGAVMQYVQKYRKFAEKHPIMQGVLYSALIAAAGISGAGLAGAGALALFKLTDQLIQGKDVRSALYTAGKTGAMAYGASKLGDLIKGGGNPDIDDIAVPSDQLGSNVPAGQPGSVINASGTPIKYDFDTALGKISDVSTISKGDTFLDIVMDASAGAADQKDLAQIMGKSLESFAKQQIDKGLTGPELSSAVNSFAEKVAGMQLQALNDLQAAGVEAAMNPTTYERFVGAAARDLSKKAIDRALSAASESVNYDYSFMVLSESDIFKLFTAVAYKQPLVESQYVDEAPIGDMIKKAGSAVAGAAKSAAGAAGDAIKKGASAVAQQAATTGKNITTKVTVDKLMKAWEKAGSPNNDEKVAEFLTGFGIDPRSVQAAFKTAGLEVPKDAPMDQVEVIVSQAKQNSKLKDAIIAYLEGPTKRTPDTGLGQQPQTATA